MEQWIFRNTVIFINNEVKSRLIKLSENWHFDPKFLSGFSHLVFFCWSCMLSRYMPGNIWKIIIHWRPRICGEKKDLRRSYMWVVLIAFKFCCRIIIQMLEYYLSPFEKDCHCFFSSESVQSVSFLLRTSVQESAE